MDRSTAKIIEILGVMIIALTVIMLISVAVMLAAGAEFVPIMAAPLAFLGIGMVIRRVGRKPLKS